MASHRRPKQPSRARVTMLTAAAATVVALTADTGALAAPAHPATPAAPSEAEVREQVHQLYQQAEAATERYDAARESVQRLRAQTDTLQQMVVAGQAVLNDLRGDLSAVADAQYRSGGLDPAVQLILSSDPDTYLTRAAALQRLGVQQADALREIADRQRTLDQHRAEATARLAQLEQARRDLARDKQEVQQRLGRAQALLDTLTREQRARLAAQEAREAAQRAARDVGRPDLAAPAAPGPRAVAAVAAAIRAVGTPYFFGASGPDAFDCSGLTYWAWQQAGVTLPRTSQGQAAAGRRISLAQARPGDLVIYYRDMHHVGMYVGGGTIIHAPYPGSRVRYDSATAMPVAAVVRI